MTQFAVTHFENAERPTRELKTFETDDPEKAKAKFQEWCAGGGPRGSGIFYFDFTLFGGAIHKHVF